MAAVPIPGRWTWPSVRTVWFRVHWLIGITAGSILLLIGLTGAILSFREEILDLVNPGSRFVAATNAAPLAPSALIATLEKTPQPVATLTLSAEPGAAARVALEPKAGERRGDAFFLDPYTGVRLPERRGHDFFEWIESVHRWLLLPREPGRVVTGVLAICLMVMAFSGIYLRWPKRRALKWRTWLALDTHLKGRHFVRAFHLWLGTICLVLYLVSTSTGLYWAFDQIRDPIDALVGELRPGRGPMAAKTPKVAPARGGPRMNLATVDTTPAWAAFTRLAENGGGWTETVMRVQAGDKPTVLFTWLDVEAGHERARNRTVVALDGTVVSDDRFAAKSTGARAVGAIYPLHMGTYFGLPGRIVMCVAALMLPVFTITGWILYVTRCRLVKTRRG